MDSLGHIVHLTKIKNIKTCDVCVSAVPLSNASAKLRPESKSFALYLFIYHGTKVTPNTNGGDLPEKHRWQTTTVISVPKVASDEETPTTNVAQMASDRKIPDYQRSTDHLGQSIAIRMALRLHDGF